MASIVAMRGRHHADGRIRAALALALLLTVCACDKSRTDSGTNSALPSGTARRDLSQDEAAGGHTLRKHVGRTDAELRERLDHERDISAASTWNDRGAAELAVGTAIAEQQSKISRWLGRDSHSNLVLDYEGDPVHPFGRTLRRGEGRVQPCAQAVIVLKRDGPDSYHVLTAYPECRS